MREISREDLEVGEAGSDDPDFEYPRAIHLADEVEVKRGLVIEFEGSKGVVFDIMSSEDESYFSVSVYWFDGPLAANEKEREKEYDDDESLALFGLKWEEESS